MNSIGHFKCLNLVVYLACPLVLSTPMQSLSANFVVGWGDNRFGQVTIPTLITNAAALGPEIADSKASLLVRDDGTVLAWGSTSQTNVPAGLSNVTAVAGGNYHALALKRDGKVVAWGDNYYGEATVPSTLSNVMAIAAGDTHNLALRSNGTVVAWGLADSRTSVPANLTNVIAIGASYANSLALKQDGTLVIWGWSGPDTDPPANLSNVVAISGTSLALKNDGTVVAWGNNSYGQTNVPTGLSNVVSIAGNGAQNLALKSDGTVVAWGNNWYGQTNIPPGLTNVSAIAVAGNANLAIVTADYGPPIITTHPTSQQCYSGMSATFAIAAEGEPTPTCQWQFNGTDLAGATGNSLALTNLQTTNSGSYRAVVTNLHGSAMSLTASLLVSNSAPLVLLPPQNQTVTAGSTATLGLPVAATGSWPLSYQWRFNNSNIAGATNASLILTNVQAIHEGNYRLVITNLYGTLFTSNAYLTVVDLGEALDSTELNWVSGGDVPWHPQYGVTPQATWGYMARSGSITNAQTSTLQTTVPGPGTLSFWWKTSCEQPGDYLKFSINGDEQARISGTAEQWHQGTFYLGPGSFDLQWTYTKDASGNAGQDAAWLDQVTYAPGITLPGISAHPAAQTLLPGSNVTFTVAAYGTPPLYYQWQFNGTDLPGATNDMLCLTNIESPDEGNYRGVVSSPYGSIASSNAFLKVFHYVGPAQPKDALDRWYYRDPATLNRVRYAGGLFIGLGDNGVLMTSSNGQAWTPRDSGTTASLHGAAYGATVPFGNRYIVVGSGGTILISSDAINWNSVSATSQDLNDVAWSGNRFVAAARANYSGQRNVFYSTTGTSWTGATFPNNPDSGFPFYTRSISIVDGYFVAAGGSMFADYIWRSSSGSIWSNVGFSDAVVQGIASGNDRAIIVGWEGWPRVSTTSGASWFASVSSVIASNAYPMVGSDIAFGNGTFLVARSFLMNGFLTTLDGLTWFKRDIFSGANVDSVAYGNGTFVALCSGGTYPAGIYQSAPAAIPVITLSLQTVPAAAALSIAGEIGRPYRLQTSSNLQTWTDLSAYTNTTPTIEFLDPITPGTARLFYRVISP